MAEWITKQAACEAVQRLLPGHPPTINLPINIQDAIDAIRALHAPEPVGKDELVGDLTDLIAALAVFSWTYDEAKRFANTVVRVVREHDRRAEKEENMESNEEETCCVCGRLASAASACICGDYPHEGEWCCSRSCHDAYEKAEGDYEKAREIVKADDRREADAEKLGHSITARTLVEVDDERIALKREADEVREVLRSVLFAPAHRSGEDPRNIATALHEYDPGGLYARATRAAKVKP